MNEARRLAAIIQRALLKGGYRVELPQDCSAEVAGYSDGRLALTILCRLFKTHR